MSNVTGPSVRHSSSMAEEYCKICKSNKAKYNCPRCNTLYCSVNCYKSQQHVECSEGFYRENIVEELLLRKSEEDGSKSAKSMLEILHRVEQSDAPHDEADVLEQNTDDEQTDSDDDEQEDELAARLSGVDLDDAASVWGRLTSAEREEFQILVENGDIMKMLPELDCWWTQEYQVDLVQAADASQQEQKLLSACPNVWPKIPNIRSLCSKEPSPSIRFNIVNVLGAYSYVYRYFYGDIHGAALEATDCLLSICLNLRKNTIFDSELMALESVTNECIQEKLPIDSMTTSVLKEHVRVFKAGPKGCGKKFSKLFTLAALSDVRSLFSGANQEFKALQVQKPTTHDKETDANLPEDDLSHLKYIEKTMLRNCLKKMDFFLAYASSEFMHV